MEVSERQRRGSLVAAGAGVVQGTLRPEAADYQGDARAHTGEGDGRVVILMVMNLVFVMMKICVRIL